MTKLHKVYLPKWQRFFVIPIIVGVWLLVTYEEFVAHVGVGNRLGLVGYLILTAILLLVTVMIWLMSSGKLPAYMIEEKD